MKVYNSRTHLECIINLFWIYTPFYSTCRPHEFRKAVKQAERAFWQVILGVDTDRFEKLWNVLISTVLGPYVHVPDILSQTSWYKSLYCCDRCCLRHKTSIDNCQPRTQSYWSFHTLKTWSGRVFSESWIWTKYGAWFRKNTKYLGGKRYLIATQEAGFTKI